jgi:hypothetical protein
VQVRCLCCFICQALCLILQSSCMLCHARPTDQGRVRIR